MVKLEPVINRCKFDLATTYSEFGGYQMVKLSKDLGLNYADLDKEKAVKANFDPAVKGRPNAFACGTGHGNDHLYTGQTIRTLLDSTSAADLAMMKGKYGSFLSCQFGKSMNTWLNAGMKSFMGYLEDFVFVAATQGPEDAIAQTFFNSHHAYDIAFIQALMAGYSVADADKMGYAASQARFQKEYDNARYPEHRQYLMYDKIIQTHGTREEVPPPPPPPKEYCVLPEFIRELLSCPY